MECKESNNLGKGRTEIYIRIYPEWNVKSTKTIGSDSNHLLEYIQNGM